MTIFTSNVSCSRCGAAFQMVRACGGVIVQCPRCYGALTVRSVLPSPLQGTPQPGLAEVLLKLLGYATVLVVAYKVLQAVSDEEFGATEFPRRFRNELREKHVASNGCRCPECGSRVAYNELTIDHIVSLKNGGRTSRANAAVMCRSCNSHKGKKNSPFDYIRGRSY